MATVTRQPLFVGRGERSPVHRLSLSVLPSLLATTLAATAAIPLPISSAKSFPNQVEAKGLTQNADTSRGTPRALGRELQLPFRVGPATQQGERQHKVLEWLNPDSSRGAPKTLLSELRRPFQVASHFAPDANPVKKWLPTDTTLELQAPLRLTPSPFVVAPHIIPPRSWWQPADTTQDLQAALRPTQTPFAIAPHIAPFRFWWQPSDTTQALQEALRPAQTPFAIAPHFAPDANQVRKWQPADTASGTAKGLKAEIALPFANRWQQQFYRPAVADSSRGTPPTLFDLQLPPGRSVYVGPLTRWLLPIDTSASVPRALAASSAAWNAAWNAAANVVIQPGALML